MLFTGNAGIMPEMHEKRSRVLRRRGDWFTVSDIPKWLESANSRVLGETMILTLRSNEKIVNTDGSKTL